MTTIGEFLGADHRRCDEAFFATERAVAAQDWSAARRAFTDFCSAIERHLAMEEQVLFAAYESVQGAAGPSQVMRGEHEQMRALLDALDDALAQGDGAQFLDLSETLLMLMRQHNMKEEQIFYPVCDRLLAAGRDAMIERMRRVQAEASIAPL